MLDVLRHVDVVGKKLLDVGTGSGVLGLFCGLRGASVTLSDVDQQALRCAVQAAQKLGLQVQVIQSDVFAKITGVYDVILFNPPYLPSDKLQDTSVDGGFLGRDMILRFLDGLPPHLSRDGFAFLLVSSHNSPASLPESFPKLTFSVEARKNFFFEELTVLRVRLR